jgi:hypothetical protein
MTSKPTLSGTIPIKIRAGILGRVNLISHQFSIDFGWHEACDTLLLKEMLGIAANTNVLDVADSRY